MLPEQTSLMVELVKSYDAFNEKLKHSDKAKIWRNISRQCNGIEGVQQRSIEQYKRHWYDLKMKVKNKVKRIHEYFSAGAHEIPELMQLTEEEVYVASFVRTMGGMRDIVDEALRNRSDSAPVRTKEQTAMLLKLVCVNRENFQKKSMPERKRIWQEITETLNKMPGAKKNVSGWKKAFWTWRLHAGDNYEEEMQRWAQKVPDNTGNEENLAIVKFGTEFHNDDVGSVIDYDDLSEEQEDRFYELFMEHKMLLRSGSSDEPLKRKLWENIANELNDLPGITLTPEEWRKKRNWGKLLANVRKQRNSSVRSTSHYTNKTNIKREDDISSGVDEVDEVNEVNEVEFEIMDAKNEECTWQNSHMKSFENYAVDDSQEFIYEGNEEETDHLMGLEGYNSDPDYLCSEKEKLAEEQQHHKPSGKKSGRLSTSSTDYSRDFDDDSAEYKPNIKRVRFTPPLAKSFKFNRRIVNAVENLTIDVTAIKDVLQTTSNSLASIEEILERQSEKQDVTNELLKRNNQLLKILIEYKRRKRTHKNQ